MLHTFLPLEPMTYAFLQRLQEGYVPRWLGSWELLIKPELLARAREQGVVTGSVPPPGFGVLQQPPDEPQ